MAARPFVVPRQLAVVRGGPVCWLLLGADVLGGLAGLLITRSDPTAPAPLRAVPLLLLVGLPLALVAVEAVGQTRWGDGVHRPFTPLVALAARRPKRASRWIVLAPLAMAASVLLAGADRSSTPTSVVGPAITTCLFGAIACSALLRRPPEDPSPSRLDRPTAVVTLGLVALTAVAIGVQLPRLHRQAVAIDRARRCRIDQVAYYDAARRADEVAIERALHPCR